jgi:hypothetical protein
MSRTAKDAKHVVTASNVYEVVRRVDGSYDIFHNEKLVQTAVLGKWLESELAKYGICGQEFRDSYHQLEQTGRAKLIY